MPSQRKLEDQALCHAYVDTHSMKHAKCATMMADCTLASGRERSSDSEMTVTLLWVQEGTFQAFLCAKRLA